MEIFFLPLDLISVLVVFLGGDSFLPIFRFILYKIDKKKKERQTIQVHKTWNLEKRREKKEIVITHIEVNSTLLLLLGRTLSFLPFSLQITEKEKFTHQN